jgi:hypothetical protein
MEARMNRAERRGGGWSKLNPALDYDGFVADVGEDSRKLMIVMLRELAGGGCPFSDRELWNSTRTLIDAGLLNIYFRFDDDGIEIKPEFPVPPQNDNRHARPWGAA